MSRGSGSTGLKRFFFPNTFASFEFLKFEKPNLFQSFVWYAVFRMFMATG